MSGIEVSGLSYAYGSKTALDDVSFAVEQGSFLAALALYPLSKMAESSELLCTTCA